MTSRRPSTANDAGPSRIPFASAEALLWGPEMKKQHAYLLTEMRALQKRHEEHNARIRTAEAVTEAAEAATSRIRDLEQQFAAIEAKNDDKAFEKWASGEITRLGVFVDTNKDVRQKQSEFDIKVSHVSEKLDRFLRDNVGIEDVLRRLDVLEHGRREDAQRIQGLEREVDRLRSLRERDASCPMQSRTGVQSRAEVREELMPSRKLDTEISDLTIASDNEESPLPQMPIHEEIQILQTPEVQGVNPVDFHTTSPPKGRSIISARRRLLQRPLIHDAKLPQPMEEQDAQPSPDENPGPGLLHSSPPPTQLVSRRNWQSKPAAEPEPEPAPPVVSVPAPIPELLPAPAPAPQRQARGRSKANGLTSEAPPTQLVERKPPGKRKQPDCTLQTQRQTRSQAKKNLAKEEEPHAMTGADAASETQPAQKTEPASPPRKKLKATPAKQRAGNKANTNGASQAASRSTRKTQNQCKVEEPSEQEPVVPAKPASTTTRSRRAKAAASRKKNPTPAPPPPVSTNSRGQRRLIVKLHLGQGDQKDTTSPQEEISAS